MATSDTQFTVIGAGHGGKAMAAHLALGGFGVRLFNRSADHVATVRLRGGIELEAGDGLPTGFGELLAVTSDYSEALESATIVMVVTPSSAHADVAKGCAPHLHDGQIVVLNPGRTGGAIEFRKVLADNDLDGLYFPQAGGPIRPFIEDPARPDYSPNNHPELPSNIINDIGLPLVTMPADYYPDGMPFNIAFIGDLWTEAQLIGYAYDLEQATRARRTPTLITRLP